MNEFNSIVLNIAIVVLIIALIVVGIILYYSIKDSKFPPFETSCPSYYTLDPDGNSCIVNTIYDNENSSNSPFNSQNNSMVSSCTNVPLTKFYQKNYTDSDILCAKKKWASGCSVFWDGVSNNPNACVKHSDSLFISNSN
jgi:hypothetical protein